MSFRRYPDGRGYPLFYSASWILTHYVRLGQGRDQLDGYLLRLQQGEDRGAAFESAFAIAYPQLQAELTRYAQAPLPTEDLRLGDLPPPSEIRLRTLPVREHKQRIAEILLDLWRETPDLPASTRRSLRGHAAALLDDVIREGADDASAYADWAASETADLALSRARFEQALARAPGDPEIQALLGDQLRAFATSDPAQRAALLEEARTLYRSALEQEPEQPRALAGLGAVSLASGQRAEEGIAALERLRTLRRHPSIDLMLARIHASTERRAEARRLATDVLDFAQHDSVWAEQAERLLSELAD